MPQADVNLLASLDDAGLKLDDAAVDKLRAYLELLRRWNRRHNLTSIDTPDAMITHHVLDCLAALRELRYSSTAADILDVGSGAGLPGALWGIAEPATQITCVDAVAKKVRFIRQVAAELGLGNVSAVHARVEDLRGEWGLITSRAFATLDDFTRLSAHLLRQRGLWVAMKGKYPGAEIEALSPEVELFHVKPIRVGGLDADRCLVILRQTTPKVEKHGKSDDKGERSP